MTRTPRSLRILTPLVIITVLLGSSASSAIADSSEKSRTASERPAPARLARKVCAQLRPVRAEISRVSGFGDGSRISTKPAAVRKLTNALDTLTTAYERAGQVLQKAQAPGSSADPMGSMAISQYLLGSAQRYKGYRVQVATNAKQERKAGGRSLVLPPLTAVQTPPELAPSPESLPGTDTLVVAFMAEPRCMGLGFESLLRGSIDPLGPQPGDAARRALNPPGV